MSTVYADIISRVHDVITAAVFPVPVYRERADAISRDECPALNLLPGDGLVDSLDRVDVHKRLFEVRIHVRAELGLNMAEMLHQQAHSAISLDQTLAGLVCSVRLQSEAIDQAGADATSTIKRCQYRVTFDTPSRTL